jgi:hypothetical protein
LPNLKLCQKGILLVTRLHRTTRGPPISAIPDQQETFIIAGEEKLKFIKSLNDPDFTETLKQLVQEDCLRQEVAV